MSGTPPDTSAPAWLFSFVDLAFLLLLAMTQLGERELPPELGEIALPELHAEASEALSPGAGTRWQVRVHPPSDGTSPFELISAETAAGDMELEVRLSQAQLRERLERVGVSRAPKPILAPHRDSRSEDLLEAVGLLEELWPDRREVTISPMVARRS
jgi:hypothetical protein